LSTRLFFTSRATADSGRPILSAVWTIVHSLLMRDSIVCLSASVMCFAISSLRAAPATRVGHVPAIRVPEAEERGGIQDSTDIFWSRSHPFPERNMVE